MKNQQMLVAATVSIALLASGYANAELKNLAPEAKVSATSEANPASGAKAAVDGRIPAAGSMFADAGATWAVDGPKSGNKADFVLEWPTPVQAAEIVYFGRTAWTLECFKDYEVYLDDAKAAAAKGSLKLMHGPQRMPFPKATVKKITIKFLNAHPGVPNAGASEIVVFSDRLTDGELGRFLAFQPNSLFSRNMVLQRGMPAPVWGTGRDGEKVTVRFRGQEVSTTARGGRWMVGLKAMEPGDPAELTIASEMKTFRFENVVVGEVWVCSGQSNMEMPVGPSFWPYRYSGVPNFQREVEGAKYPGIRFCYVNRAAAGAPKDDVDCAPWAACSPETAAGFSAIGYFFARHVYENLKVPVGIIDASRGATMIEPWIPRDGLAGVRGLEEAVKAVDKAEVDYRKAVAASPDKPPAVSQHQPAAQYNAMIHPMVPFAIRGALWYQGEGNLGQGKWYRDKMEALIGGWRKAWGQGDFPFYFVQLAPYDYPGDPNRLQSVWEAQLASLEIPNTGMAVTTDITEVRNIHPPNKQDVGKRLALWALAKTYGQKGVVCSGPLYRRHSIEKGRVRVQFDHVGSGLASRDGKDLDWFEIAGADRKFVKAQAKIDGETVVVWSDQVPAPAAVRFGWHKTAMPNLMNKEGLPASPFRTNRWEGNAGR